MSPDTAIRAFEGRNFVLIKNGNLQQRVDIKLGIQNDSQVEIEDGLSEGQIVCEQVVITPVAGQEQQLARLIMQLVKKNEERVSGCGRPQMI